MLDPDHPISKLAREDGRYRVDAYAFVFDALNHAHSAMNMGSAAESLADVESDLSADDAPSDSPSIPSDEDEQVAPRKQADRLPVEPWFGRRRCDFGRTVHQLGIGHVPAVHHPPRHIDEHRALLSPPARPARARNTPQQL